MPAAARVAPCLNDPSPVLAPKGEINHEPTGSPGIGQRKLRPPRHRPPVADPHSIGEDAWHATDLPEVIVRVVFNKVVVVERWRAITLRLAE
jgi:hypothetical protein